MYSYLPLAHVMERLQIVFGLTHAAYIGFVSGADIKKYMLDDIVLIKPTVFLAAPRILVTLH